MNNLFPGPGWWISRLDLISMNCYAYQLQEGEKAEQFYETQTYFNKVDAEAESKRRNDTFWGPALAPKPLLPELGRLETKSCVIENAGTYTFYMEADIRMSIAPIQTHEGCKSIYQYKRPNWFKRAYWWLLNRWRSFIYNFQDDDWDI